MVRFSTTAATIVALAMTVAAVPAPMPALPDPAGASKKGNQNNQQFIGGECINSNDCALGTACCATLGSIGVCSGLQADFQAGKTGCGFGDGDASPAVPAPSGVDVVPVPTAAPGNNGGGNGNGNGSGNGSGSGSVVIDLNAPGSANVGAGNGAQFITGQCISDADCASTCCADGKCAAAAVVNSPQDPRTCGFVGTLARA